MIGLGDVEQAIRHRLSLLRSGTVGTFRDIDAVAGSTQARWLECLARMRKPAVVVVYSGRERTKQAEPVRFSLVVCTEGLRSTDEARLGSDDAPGMHALLDLLRDHLDGTMLTCGCRLVFQEESPMASDERLLVYEQVYSVEGLG